MRPGRARPPRSQARRWSACGASSHQDYAAGRRADACATATRCGIPFPMTAIHGHFLAAEVGELAGVSGTTIGQWARWGYIRSSVSGGDPHVYSVEDVGEAVIVGELLA